MGLISRVSSRTYSFFRFYKMSAIVLTPITILTIGVVLYYILSNDGYRVDLEWFLHSLHPNWWAAIGVFSSIALSITGAAWGILQQVVLLWEQGY